MDATLRCYACGATAPWGDGARCDCGEPYWFDVDADGFAWPDGGERSLWRDADLLPTDPGDWAAARAARRWSARRASTATSVRASTSR